MAFKKVAIVIMICGLVFLFSGDPGLTKMNVSEKEIEKLTSEYSGSTTVNETDKVDQNLTSENDPADTDESEEEIGVIYLNVVKAVHRFEQQTGKFPCNPKKILFRNGKFINQQLHCIWDHLD